MVSVEQLNSIGINDGLRPENLGLVEYVAIADLLADSRPDNFGADEVNHD